MGVVLYSGFYSVELLRSLPDLLFVFGDNMKGFGKGGQAIIRDEPNAFGVPTKRLPSMHATAFMHDDQADSLDAVLTALKEVWSLLNQWRDVVIPILSNGEVSLGRGLAKLDETGPAIYATIQQHVTEMVAAYGSESYGDHQALTAAY